MISVRVNLPLFSTAVPASIFIFTSNENDMLNDLNSIRKKITFTHENEIDNTINYLDLTITKNLQKKVIDIGKYHKPISNTSAIHNISRHTFQKN